MPVLSVKEIISVYNFDNFIPSFSSCIENHDFWQIKYIRSGDLGFIVGNETLECHLGQLLIVPPDTKLTFRFERGKPMHYSVVNFRCINADVLYKIALQPITLYGINQINFNDFIHTASNKNMTSTNIFAEYHYLSLTVFLLRICCINEDSENVFSHTYKPSSTFNDNAYIAESVKKYLQNNIECDVSLDGLSQEIGVSKNTMMRKFRFATGLSIMQYFTKMKIERSIDLICTTDLSIKSISERLNFQSPGYFSTVFKKQLGISPIDFSKRSLNWNGCLDDYLCVQKEML